MIRAALRPSAIVLGLMILCVGLSPAPAALAAKQSAAEKELVKAPRKVVGETIGKVLEILKQQEISSGDRRKQIEGLAFEVFDFTTMSKLVLARNWKKFDKAQRQEFVDEFKSHLARNYGSRLDRYQQTDVAIVGTRIEPRNDVTVRSKVVGGQFDGIEMNYRMREKKGVWRVIDVVIEGVSLVANFRSQFVSIVSRGGPEELLRQLKEKNFDSEVGSESETGSKTDTRIGQEAAEVG